MRKQEICIAHHRFVWIHPFENGNGRVVRLFTYALLLKNVFKSKQRIINPTAVFCSDRNEYYNYLSLADTYTNEGLIKWCEYVLHGLKNEIEKIDRLVDYVYLRDNILLPSMSDSLSNKYITDIEYNILRAAITNERLVPVSERARKYVISFGSNYLLRSVLKSLDKNGFLPLND